MDARAARESPADVVLAVPEIRDYHAINSEIVRHLDSGRRTVRLSGVQGQRLLAAGLTGSWDAVLEIDGDAGPELAAGLESPGLIVVCRGGAGDGGAGGLKAGRVVVLGDVGTAFGYAQRGGLAVAAGDAGARAGLGQSGGDLVLLGAAGPMAGERQSGGRLHAVEGRLGSHAGRGRRGGQFLRIAAGGVEADRIELIRRLEPVRPWLEPAAGWIFSGRPGTTLDNTGPVP